LKRYGGLPELFDINKRGAANLGYPLRPEFIESNLYLYRVSLILSPPEDSYLTDEWS
jgi:mannosidase alpha-like ER degradation enhancer 1